MNSFFRPAAYASSNALSIRLSAGVAGRPRCLRLRLQEGAGVAGLSCRGRGPGAPSARNWPGCCGPTMLESSQRGPTYAACWPMCAASSETMRPSPPFLTITRQGVQFNRSATIIWTSRSFKSCPLPGALDAVASEQLEEAVNQMRGPFLAGFSISDSPCLRRVDSAPACVLRPAGCNNACRV